MDHKPNPAAQKGRLRWLISIQLLLVLLVPFFVFHIQNQPIRQENLRELSSMAQQKAGQVEAWLNERLGDAQVLQNNPLFTQVAVALNHDPHYSAIEINETFSQLQRHMGYESLTLFDQHHIPRISLGNLPTKKLNATPIPSNARSITTNWFYDDSGQLHLGINIPLRDPHSFFVIGSLQLTQVIKTELLPHLQIWPASSTGNTFILQHYEDRLLVMRIPANDVLHTEIKDIPNPKNSASLLSLALVEHADTYEGLDANQNDVLASYLPVAYTGWHVLLQQESAEIFAPLYNQLWWIAGAVFLSGLLVVLIINMSWRQQQYRNELDMQRQTAEKDRLLRHFFELPLFGMAITHSFTGHWIRFNNQLCDMLGYTREEIIDTSLASLMLNGDTDSEMQAMMLDLSDGYQSEKQLRHKDGHIIYANVDTRCVRADNRRISFIITVIEDISLRKASESELRKQTNLYNMLSHTNQSIVHCQDRADLFQRVCQTAIDDGGFSLAMIAQCSSEKDDLNIIHVAGDHSGFCQWITEQKRYAPEIIPRTGAMQAIYQQQNIVINDYLHEHLTAPFRKMAEKANISSAGYYLIHENGQLFGVIALYASEVNFFTEKVQATLEEVAGDVGFALENLKRDQQLIASERLFHNLTTFVQVGIFRLNLDGKLVYINEFGTALLQIKRNTARESWLNKIVPADLEQLHQCWLPSLLHQGESEMECQLQLPNNQLSWLIIHARAETNAQGDVIGYIGTLTDIRKIKETEARLKYQAHYDPLTQLPNRTLLALNLNQSLQAATLNNQRIALLILDLDRFKDVNDSFGHPMGDALLQEVARRLQQHLQMTNKISRLGGDEFTILLDSNPPRELINAIAYDIIQLMKRPFHLPNDRDVMLGASVGISLYPEHGTTPEELMQKADAAMYHAKASGRNCYKYFSDELTGLADHRLDMEIQLKRAIEKSEFRVYFQPQTDIQTGKIIGAEALIRWQDPLRGLIPPIQFIPLAEETGLIKLIGEWVLKETCRQGKQWLDNGLPPLTLAVNISPIQFHYSDLFSTVIRTLSETGFPAHLLELELTESALMDRENEAIAILTQLQAEGVKLAIDDFGTGYSSLSYLKRLPLDVLKIDKSFVDDIPHKKDDMEIAATIVAIAHTLRLKVLAEGVETEQQLAFLSEQGCDCYQGYLMSKPVPAEQFEQLLRENHALPPL